MHFCKSLALAAAALPMLAQAQNLSSVLSDNEDLSVLAGFVSNYPGVVSRLAGLKNSTLLLPENTAFEKLLETIQLDSLSEEQVNAILNYHVLPGQLFSANFTDTPAYLPTLLEGSMYTNVTGGQVVGAYLEDNGTAIIQSGYNSRAQVVQPNITFDGGVAHIISELNYIPENITSTAVAANLTYFAGALLQAGLINDLTDMKDVTVFAPSNSAIMDIAGNIANASMDDLAAILSYHVINGTVAYSPSIANGTVTTLGGKSLNLTVEDGAVFVNSARVVNADILVANGVLHVIDSVLNPMNNGTAPDAANTSAQPAFPESTADPSGLTSGLPSATTTFTLTTTLEVASGFEPTGTVGASSGLAPLQTVGPAMLFGGMAAFAINW